VTGAPAPALSQRRILDLWWPLAASWLLMGVELPLFTACVARMPAPEVNLAAYGSLVFPIALVIEAPIMMLLAAATALASDRDSWAKVRRFMHAAGGTLTAVHVAMAFTPLFDLVARGLFDVPGEVVEPARLGLRLMTPWTWSIAYRRTHQGVLIRYEHGRPVVLGTLLRLAANAAIFALGFALQAHGHDVPGIVVGTSAVASGVLSEALFIGWCTRGVLAERGLAERPAGAPLTRAAFLRFYVPLALTPLIALFTLPIGAAAMARMKDPLLSLAAWPAVHGILFLTRAPAFAYNEVVVSLLEQAGAGPALRRFGAWIGGGAMLVLFLLATTPLAGLWFGSVSGLSAGLTALAAVALLFALPAPGLQAMQSWYQGSLVHARATRGVTEAMLFFFLLVALCFWAGVRWSDRDGIHYAVLTFTLGSGAQTAWLAFRAARARASGS
jgi:hypothetical protein